MPLGLKDLQQQAAEGEAPVGPYVIVAYKTGKSEGIEDGTEEVWGPYDNAVIVSEEMTRIEAGLPEEWDMVATPLKKAPTT